MNLFFLMLLFSCVCCSCVPDRCSKVECPRRMNPDGTFLRGSLVDNRYYSEDGSFSLTLMGFDASEAEIFENKDEICTSVAFSFFSGPTIRYDLFPVDNVKMLFSLCEADYRQEFFKIFANQMILQPFRAQCSSLDLSIEEIVSVGDESYYFGLIHGPISRAVNPATGQRSDDYAGIFIGLKGPNVLVIQLQKGSQTYHCKEKAKEELLPRMLYLYEECFVETCCEGK